MIQPASFPRFPINNKKIKKIKKIRYFEGSSFYLALGIGLLELVARSKDFNFEAQEDQLFREGVEKFLRVFDEDHGLKNNFFVQIAEYLKNYVENTDSCLQVLERFIEKNESNLVLIERGCKDLIFSFFDESSPQILTKIDSGEDPITILEEVLRTISRKFRVFFKFYSLSQEFYFVNPIPSGAHLRLYLIYNSQNYSIGYSSQMCMFDENNNRDIKVVEKLFKYRSEFEKRASSNLGISSRDLKLENKINSLQKSIDTLVDYLNRKDLLNHKIAYELSSLKINFESQEIDEYLDNCKKSQLKNKNFVCSVCSDYFGEDDFFRLGCNVECQVCFKCLVKNDKKCLKCKKNLNKSVVEEIFKRVNKNKFTRK
jgi:hypothetical protein